MYIFVYVIMFEINAIFVLYQFVPIIIIVFNYLLNKLNLFY